MFVYTHLLGVVLGCFRAPHHRYVPVLVLKQMSLSGMQSDALCVCFPSSWLLVPVSLAPILMFFPHSDISPSTLYPTHHRSNSCSHLSHLLSFLVPSDAHTPCPVSLQLFSMLLLVLLLPLSNHSLPILLSPHPFSPS